MDDIELAEILCAVAPSKLPLPKPGAIWVRRACRKDSSHQITGISWSLVGREDRHVVVALAKALDSLCAAYATPPVFARSNEGSWEDRTAIFIVLQPGLSALTSPIVQPRASKQKVRCSCFRTMACSTMCQFTAKARCFSWGRPSFLAFRRSRRGTDLASLLASLARRVMTRRYSVAGALPLQQPT